MRKVFLVVSFTLLCIVGWMSTINIKSLYLLLILLPLIGLGLFDMFQSKRTIRRNFPLLGRMRYLLESIDSKDGFKSIMSKQLTQKLFDFVY